MVPACLITKVIPNHIPILIVQSLYDVHILGNYLDYVEDKGLLHYPEDTVHFSSKYSSYVDQSLKTFALLKENVSIFVFSGGFHGYFGWFGV